MQIIHRVTLSATPDDRVSLARWGVSVGEGFASFEVDEAHPDWARLRDWMAGREVVDVVTTKFSKGELAGADWLQMEPTWHHGYPQPAEKEFGYRQATYDLTNWCEKCGSGLKQKGPFQMKGEPRWGRNGILQLNWVFDEFFVTPEVWASVFEPNQIACQPVTNRDGAELKTVVQLVVDGEVAILGEGLPVERCSRCGRSKFLPTMRGFFPALMGKPSRSMVKTEAFFGSGARAHREMLVARPLAQALTVARVRGVSLRPAGTSHAESRA